jgi:hypothetical protein
MRLTGNPKLVTEDLLEPTAPSLTTALFTGEPSIQ